LLKLILLLQDNQGIGGIASSLLPFLLIILVFYFLILRPQQKRQKEKQRMMDAVKKGDKIITSSGIYGTIEGIEDKTVLVKISDTSKVKMERSAIAAVISDTVEEKK
jgi:preprotein translocase subunit YajC